MELWLYQGQDCRSFVSVCHEQRAVFLHLDWIISCYLPPFPIDRYIVCTAISEYKEAKVRPEKFYLTYFMVKVSFFLIMSCITWFGYIPNFLIIVAAATILFGIVKPWKFQIVSALSFPLGNIHIWRQIFGQVGRSSCIWFYYIGLCSKVSD